MNGIRWAAVALACLPAACVRTSNGVPVGGDPTATWTAPATTAPTDKLDRVDPGVVPTARAAIPPNTVTCAQPTTVPVRMSAEVDDPGAPRIAVGVPDGWSMAARDGHVGGRLVGPNGMWATVTIAPTQLAPAAAFTKYTDDLMAESAVSTLSVMPAELCGYSGQKLIGAWSDTPQNSAEYADRIVHVWTNTKAYLVAVHVQAPTATGGFDAASKLLTEDFEIDIP